MVDLNLFDLRKEKGDFDDKTQKLRQSIVSLHICLECSKHDYYCLWIVCKVKEGDIRWTNRVEGRVCCLLPWVFETLLKFIRLLGCPRFVTVWVQSSVRRPEDHATCAWLPRSGLCQPFHDTACSRYPSIDGCMSLELSWCITGIWRRGPFVPTLTCFVPAVWALQILITILYWWLDHKSSVYNRSILEAIQNRLVSGVKLFTFLIIIPWNVHGHRSENLVAIYRLLNQCATIH